MSITLDVKQLAKRVGISESTVRRRVQERRQGIDNGFPLPLFPEGKKLVWDMQTVSDWIENPPQKFGSLKLVQSPAAKGKSFRKITEELKEFGFDNE